MPPRISGVSIGLSRVSNPLIWRNACPFCSVSQIVNSTPRSKHVKTSQLQQHRIHPRMQSNQASDLSEDNKALRNLISARQQLRDALLDVQKHAGSYINISRLQLALRGLDQAPGQETIRVAILGLADGADTLTTAKHLLRAVIADPLKEEEEWERTLLQPESNTRTLLLKIGGNETEDVAQNRLVKDIKVSWPNMNENNIEILVLETDPPPTEATTGEKIAFADALLVPTMEIPTSTTGRHTHVTTPVHKALIVANGFNGVVSLLTLHTNLNNLKTVNAVANLQLKDERNEISSLGIQVVDVKMASHAIETFRHDMGKALFYEQHWFESRMDLILEWIKDGTSTTDAEMKPPVRALIESLLQNTLSAVQAERSAQLQARLSANISSSNLNSLRAGLSQWAERAHTELRDQLDIAFKGRRWRKLGWWKLFWRVDDVSMITIDMLNQRFLINAEKEAVFLAGRLQQSKAVGNSPLLFGPEAYKYEQEPLGPGPPPPTIQGLIETPNDEVPIKSEPKSWPLDIPATRTLLAIETVPALQALAQKLVMQTLTTSGFVSVLAGLIYVSSISTSAYEAGAVAALGTVWSLRRMQRKWETAREFWEGEVREDGRRAVRGTESSFGTVLQETHKTLEGSEEQELAEKAVEKAQAALRACK